MNSCKRAEELMSRSLEKRLALTQQIGLWYHLGMCKLCRRFKCQIQFIRTAMLNLDDQLCDEQTQKNFSQAILSDECRKKIKAVAEKAEEP